MSLLGHITQGDTAYPALSADQKWALKVTATEAGTISTLFADMQNLGSEIQVFRAGVYADAVSFANSALLDSSDQVWLSPGMTRQWVTFPNLAATLISGNSYWLTLQAGPTGGNAVLWYEAGVGSEVNASDSYANGLEDPFGPLDVARTRSPAIYASYVPTSGVGSLSTGISRILTGSAGWK